MPFIEPKFSLMIIPFIKENSLHGYVKMHLRWQILEILEMALRSFRGTEGERIIIQWYNTLIKPKKLLKQSNRYNTITFEKKFSMKVFENIEIFKVQSTAVFVWKVCIS